MALGLTSAMFLGGDAAANAWHPQPAESRPTTTEQTRVYGGRSVEGIGCSVLSMTVDGGEVHADLDVRGLNKITSIDFITFKEGRVDQILAAKAAGDINPGGLSNVRGATRIIDQEGDTTRTVPIVATAQDHDRVNNVSIGVTCVPAYSIELENGLPVSATPIQYGQNSNQ